MIKLSPSILSADFANLERDVRVIADAGCDYVHVDVMDGHFVPNITIGAPVVKALRRVTELTLDVHLMISDPDRYLDDFIKAGADIITVHYEANGDTRAQLRHIRAAGVRASVSIKPATPVEVLFPLLPELDMALFTNKKSKSTPETSKTALEFVRPILDGIADWTEASLHDTVMAAIPESGMKNATVLWPLRIAITGRAATPGGAFEMAYLLGKDETMKRLDDAMAKL